MRPTPPQPHALPDPLSQRWTSPWLPGDQGRLTVSKLGEVRRAPGRTDAFEIECFFEGPDGPLQAWAPFEQLGQLATGATFEHGEFAGVSFRRPDLITQKLEASGTAVLESLSHPGERPPQASQADRYRLLDVTPIAQEPWGQRHDEPPVCISDDGGRQVLIPSFELLRFYFGPLSLGANAFMAAAAQDPGEDLADFSATGFVDDDVFRIAPNEALLDRGSALHLAMLLGSPDLSELWMNTALGLAFANGRDYPKYPVVVAPAQARRLRLAGTVVDIQHGLLPVMTRAFKASRILGDERQPPFKRLIVRLPRNGGRDFDDEFEVPHERQRRRAILQADLVLDNSRRPGLTAVTRSTLFQSMLAAFPNFAGVKISYEPAAARSGVRHATTENATAVDALSLLPVAAGGETGALKFRPGRLADPPDTTIERLAATLLDKPVDESRTVNVPVEELAFPLPTFFRAFSILSRIGTGSLLFQDPLASLANEVSLLQAPTSWPETKRTSRHRRMAVGLMLIDDRPVYAFELERWSIHERISLFLAKRSDGQMMSRADLSAVFRHAVCNFGERGSPGGERGVWPAHGYSDIIGRTVPHRARRRYASCLAEDLDDLARAMVGDYHHDPRAR